MMVQSGQHRTPAGGAYVPTLVVGMYAAFGVVGRYPRHDLHAESLYSSPWHVADRTTGDYIATKSVATYAPPASWRSRKARTSSKKKLASRGWAITNMSLTASMA